MDTVTLAQSLETFLYTIMGLGSLLAGACLWVAFHKDQLCND